MSQENMNEKKSKMERFIDYCADGLENIEGTIRKAAAYLPTKLLYRACAKQSPSMADVALKLGADANSKDKVWWGKVERHHHGFGCTDRKTICITPFVFAAVVACEQKKQDNAQTQKLMDTLQKNTNLDSVARVQSTWRMAGSFRFLKGNTYDCSLKEVVKDRTVALLPEEVCAFLRTRQHD